VSVHPPAMSMRTGLRAHTIWSEATRPAWVPVGAISVRMVAAGLVRRLTSSLLSMLKPALPCRCAAALLSFELRAEHGVVYAFHERLVVGQRLGRRQSGGRIFARSILEVELVEHAMGVVLGQHGPAEGAEGPALRREPVEVGGSRDLFGTQLCSFLKQGLAFGRGVEPEHIAQQLSKVVDGGGHGEQRLLLQGTLELVVEALGARHPLGGPHGHDVDTLPRGQFKGPVVAWHAGDDVVVRERPTGAMWLFSIQRLTLSAVSLTSATAFWMNIEG
jgi:hypothetical protein